MRIQPRWWIGLGVYLTYMGWVFAAWTYLDIDYAALGSQANLLRGVIVPLGIAAIVLCAFNGLAGWWPQATREPPLRQPVFLAAVLVPMLGFIGMNLYSTAWAAIGMEHVLVLAALWLRFGRKAWRAWMPTVVASMVVVGVLTAFGAPWQLFNVLALMLLLGVGIDYGIFLQEHEDDPHAWLAVVIGAGSTWLSFGLLGLSATPALKAFGLTLMLGLPLVLVLAPLFRSATDNKEH